MSHMAAQLYRMPRTQQCFFKNIEKCECILEKKIEDVWGMCALAESN